MHYEVYRKGRWIDGQGAYGSWSIKESRLVASILMDAGMYVFRLQLEDGSLGAEYGAKEIESKLGPDWQLEDQELVASVIDKIALAEEGVVPLGW